MNAVTANVSGPISLLDRVRDLFAKVRVRLLFGLKERTDYYDNIIAMHGSVPTDVALEEIVAVNRRLRRPVASVYEEMLAAVNSGSDHTRTIEPFFPNIEATLLVSGAEAGSVDGYRAASVVANGLARVRNVLVTHLAYPAVLTLVFFLILTTYARTALPQLERLKDKISLSWDDQLFVAMLRVVQDDKLTVALVIGAALALYLYLLPRASGKLRELADQYIPPFVVYRIYTSAVFLLSLAAMLSAGIPLERALMQLQRTASPYLRSHIDPILAAVMLGRDEVEAFSTGLFAPSILVRIAALSRSGSLGEAIPKIAEGALEYCIRMIVTVAAVMAVVVILAVAVVVGYAFSFLNTIGLAAAGG